MSSINSTGRPNEPVGASVFRDQQHLLVGQDDWAKGAYETNTAGLVLPKVLTDFKPKYTPDAMRAKLQVSVTVEIIVAPDGTVAKARIKPTPEGQSTLAWRADGTGDVAAGIKQLVESALETAQKWTFEPGMLNGQPVPVRTILMLEFRLH